MRIFFQIIKNHLTLNFIEIYLFIHWIQKKHNIPSIISTGLVNFVHNLTYIKLAKIIICFRIRKESSYTYRRKQKRDQNSSICSSSTVPRRALICISNSSCFSIFFACIDAIFIFFVMSAP